VNYGARTGVHPKIKQFKVANDLRLLDCVLWN
jgi:hypothetical protein